MDINVFSIHFHFVRQFFSHPYKEPVKPVEQVLPLFRGDQIVKPWLLLVHKYLNQGKVFIYPCTIKNRVTQNGI